MHKRSLKEEATENVNFVDLIKFIFSKKAREKLKFLTKKVPSSSFIRSFASFEQSFHNFHTWHGVLSDVSVSHNMCNDKNPLPFKSDISIYIVERKTKKKENFLFIWKLFIKRQGKLRISVGINE